MRPKKIEGARARALDSTKENCVNQLSSAGCSRQKTLAASGKTLLNPIHTLYDFSSSLPQKNDENLDDFSASKDDKSNPAPANFGPSMYQLTHLASANLSRNLSAPLGRNTSKSFPEKIEKCSAEISALANTVDLNDTAKLTKIAAFSDSTGSPTTQPGVYEKPDDFRTDKSSYLREFGPLFSDPYSKMPRDSRVPLHDADDPNLAGSLRFCAYPPGYAGHVRAHPAPSAFGFLPKPMNPPPRNNHAKGGLLDSFSQQLPGYAGHRPKF